MKTTDHDAGSGRTASGAPEIADKAAPRASEPQLGEHAPALLSTEHWSLLAARSLIWNEAQSRATVFLTVLSAATIALALSADATGFGDQTTTLALVLLPVVFLLGIAAYARLVQINAEEFQLLLAMNRLRHAYLELEPALAPYLTTSPHDDQLGVMTTYMVPHPTRRSLWLHFLLNTPNIIATVNAALAAAITTLALKASGAPTPAQAAAATAAFASVWTALFLLQKQTLHPFDHQSPRFPTPPTP